MLYKNTSFQVVPKPEWYRQDIVSLLPSHQGNVGIELGVAEGVFSDRLMRSGRFGLLFGVDMYADMHDTNQYKRALRKVGLLRNYRLLRMRFDEALELFDDEFFDFIYVDGYAHSGEEGGETIFDWFRKLKVGGVMAGDDYAEQWPLVVRAVNEFAAQTGLPLFVTGKIEEKIDYCLYPSWAVVKTQRANLRPPSDWIKEGKAVARRVATMRQSGRMFRSCWRLAKLILPKTVIEAIKRNA